MYKKININRKNAVERTQKEMLKQEIIIMAELSKSWYSLKFYQIVSLLSLNLHDLLSIFTAYRLIGFDC